MVRATSWSTRVSTSDRRSRDRADLVAPIASGRYSELGVICCGLTGSTGRHRHDRETIPPDARSSGLPDNGNTAESKTRRDVRQPFGCRPTTGSRAIAGRFARVLEHSAPTPAPPAYDRESPRYCSSVTVGSSRRERSPRVPPGCGFGMVPFTANDDVGIHLRACRLSCHLTRHARRDLKNDECLPLPARGELA